jgi:hypothetical protein
MGVGRHFRGTEGVCLFSRPLAQDNAIANVHRRAASEVGQGKVNPAIASVRRSQEREKRLVLIDRQQLSVAQRPAFRGEDEREHPNFSEKWFSHMFLGLAAVRVRC